MPFLKSPRKRIKALIIAVISLKNELFETVSFFFRKIVLLLL